MYLVVKRIFDFFAALCAILVLLPFMIPVIIGLMLTGEHYVFYFQQRIGLGGKPFDIWKFATMLKNSPNMGTGTNTVRNDPRILPMGKFLRATKINELPQLMNILLGSMSVVGPRPLVPKEFAMYSPKGQEIIGKSKPGLSGIGSIIFRDEEKYISQVELDEVNLFFEKVIQPRKEQLEKWYFDHRSLWVDFCVIWMTVWVVLNSESDIAYKVFPDLPRFDMQAAVDEFKAGR